VGGGVMDFKYEGTEELVDLILQGDIEPTYDYLEILTPRDFDYDEINRDKPVSWIGNHYLLDIPVENIHFMEGNQWYLGHAMALYEGIENNTIKYLNPPVARVYRITAEDIKRTQKYERDGELEYQMSMTSPWERSDLRTYNAQLLDGNHRALAAIAAGASTITVYVSQNYRDEIYKKDWLRH
jgi:hypothetical protein